MDIYAARINELIDEIVEMKKRIDRLEADVKYLGSIGRQKHIKIERSSIY